MPKSLTTLDSLRSDILEKRRKTQGARFKPLPTGVERVEDVIRQAVDYLGARLASFGFKAAPSKLSFSRKSRVTKQVIALQADRENLSGVSVQVSVHVYVRSPSFKRWLGKHGTRDAHDLLWGGQLGYLSGHNEYFLWQLVEPKAREAELSDLLSRIHALAFPVFELWADKESISRAVFRRTEVDRIDWLTEIALWCGNFDAAKRLVAQHLQLRPLDIPEFKSELARFLGDTTIREPRSSPVSGAAFLAARHGLEVIV